MARMPSPWKVSPAPRRSDSISLLNEISKRVSGSEPRSVRHAPPSINPMRRLSDIRMPHEARGRCRNLRQVATGPRMLGNALWPCRGGRLLLRPRLFAQGEEDAIERLRHGPRLHRAGNFGRAGTRAQEIRLHHEGVLGKATG